MRTLACVLVLALASAAPAAAQSRFTIWINGAYQAAPQDFGEQFEFTYRDDVSERATAEIDYAGEAGPVFDGGFGVRLWKQLGVGVSVARFSSDSSGNARARLPHPFFLNQFRDVEGELSNLSHSELGIHLQLQYEIPTNGRLQVVLGAGPSMLRVEQDVVGELNFEDEFPFDAPTLAAPTATRVSSDGIGFNAGADIRWMFNPRVGIGALLRYTHASVDLEVPDRANDVSVDAGGFQVGAGLRLRF